MKSLFTTISILAVVLPLLMSCSMSMDSGLILDPSGRTCLSVRGYVYQVTDPEGAAGGAMVSVPAEVQPLEVCIYDRSDISFADPLVSSYGVTDFNGYYEIDIDLSPEDDIIIRVGALDDAGNVTGKYAGGFYSWSPSLYDKESGRYLANMPPLYI